MYINELEIERFKASTNRKKNELTNYVRLITRERVQKCRLNRVKLLILSNCRCITFHSVLKDKSKNVILKCVAPTSDLITSRKKEIEDLFEPVRPINGS